MDRPDIQFLFDYERWATRRILTAAAGLDDATWATPNAIGERGLGGIMVHHLGAHQRWREGLSGAGEASRPEGERLPSVAEMTARWEREWAVTDAWVETITDAWLENSDDGVMFWQMLAHVVNHGTQHRAEAAALLTDLGRSPGDLDMIDFAESRAVSPDGDAVAPDGPGADRGAGADGGAGAAP